MDASPRSEPLFLVGQMLAAGEAPASGTGSIPLRQRRALELCLAGERLDYRRRNGWQHPQGSVRIHNATITALATKGMIVVINRGTFKKHARLTARGIWIARTLVTEKIETVRRICAERNAERAQ